MENTNSPQSPQQVPVQSVTKKWYDHKAALVIIILFLIAVTVVLVYFIENQPQNYGKVIVPHLKAATENQSITTSTLNQIDIPNWKTYTNKEYGFSLQYPNTWTDTGRSVDIEEYFTKSPEVDVFDINAVNATGTLTDFANNDITQNNCPGDQIIQTTSNGVLYVLNCSAMSESYLYIFRNSQNQAIQLSYHDDFDENASIATKIATLNQIISTISITGNSESSLSFTTQANGWTTLQNNDFGFKISYPPGFSYEEDAYNSGKESFSLNIIDSDNNQYINVLALKGTDAADSNGLFITTNQAGNVARTVAGLNGRELWAPVPAGYPAPLEDPDDWFYKNTKGMVWELTLDPVTEGHITQDQVTTDESQNLDPSIYAKIRDSFVVINQ